MGKLPFLIAEREMIFSRFSKLCDDSKKISDFESQEKFLEQSALIDDSLREFKVLSREIAELQEKLNKKPPDFAIMASAEELYLSIRYKRSGILNSRSVAVPAVNTKIERVRLPAIDLPSFDGKMENWPVFYESFKVNIHDNDELSDSQRVQYLMGKLTQDARRLTSGVVPTGATYSIIWEGLKKKFQDRRLLGTYYLNNIFDLKNCVHNAKSSDSFVEVYAASLAALKQLDIADLGDFILFQCALRKLDTQTAQAFETSVRNVEFPSTERLIDYLRDQVKILERSNQQTYANLRNVNSGNKPSGAASRDVRGSRSYRSFVSATSAASSACCPFCNSIEHVKLENCAKFKRLPTPQARYELVKAKEGCINCLSVTHSFSACRSSGVCEKCRRRHHTLLHFNNNKSKPLRPATGTSASTPPVSSSATMMACSISTRSSGFGDSVVNEVSSSVHDSVTLASNSVSTATILLATAQVYARRKGGHGHREMIRCLIDNGSQNNLITADCCRALNLSVTPLNNSVIKGIGSASRPVLGYVFLEIQSRVYPEHTFNIHALVVESITDPLPSHPLTGGDNLYYLKDLPLADSSWNVPGNVDLVLGAQLFPKIYSGSKVDAGECGPPALSTVFGYVLMGDWPRENVRLEENSESTSLKAVALNELLHQFWELEEVPQKHLLSPEETECENSFTSSVSRDLEGRYTVSLPFCRDPAGLGESRTGAYRRFMSLEKKMRHESDLKEKYNQVFREYIDNGYLSVVDEADIVDDGYFIPHHAVIRSEKPLPRIVLDASAKTRTGLSLNDILHTGPNLQSDLFVLLLNFRLFPVAMNADIKQMYLRIGVPQDQRKYLRILFRFNEEDVLRTYQFNCLPFGLKSSPYLAMRTVRQLAADLSPHFSEAAKVASSHLYMDDLVYSAPDEKTAERLSKDLVRLFEAGKFELVKWSSNSKALLNSLPNSVRKSIDFDTECHGSKVLGLSWEPRNDTFFFTTHPIIRICTKRYILSVVARLFDVLGLVAPVIMYAKLLIKELWLSNIGWDDVAPDRVLARFSSLSDEFSLLNNLHIPRHIGARLDSVVRLVAFCDASLNGYGCVVYAHCTSATGIHVGFLCAKSKVSPTKIQTLARLELCAAVLMAKLVKIVRDTYSGRIPIADIFAFSDSTIALSWIHSSPHRWSIFVSNRVAQCQENLASNHFYHIAGKENPSDCLSRGILPSELLNHDLWWSGPSWLQTPHEDWPITSFSPSRCEEMPEHKTNILTVISQVEPPILSELAQRCSSWNKLLRTTVYILHFIRRINKQSLNSLEGSVIAERAVIRAVQSFHFSHDIASLKAGSLPAKKLQALAVFLDEEGLLRIGGRLTVSDLPFEAKHPVLLPKRDRIVDLIISHYHIINCHTGPGLLMSIIRQRFWILDGRTTIRARCRNCNVCFRFKPTHPTPRMADLPECRVRDAKAFVHTGVDLAGPLSYVPVRRRGQRSQKIYICLFICLTTKAIHLELISDLSSESFLAALKRFISRRGPVSVLYSDNGTNFIGAKARLNETYTFLLNQRTQADIKREMLKCKIDWKMIPPRAPHFGGLWESNIKSVKTHLYRVMGRQLLTYEELLTLLVQVEGILNSRPLCVVSADPLPDVLTPAHFLMSSPLTSLPSSEIIEDANLRDRKRLLDQLVLSYWKKWRREYLHTLQVRQKWCSPEASIKTGTVVLVERDNIPPLIWPLGVITEVFPGSDGTVRVVEVKTASGTYKRPVVKVYPIPTQ